MTHILNKVKKLAKGILPFALAACLPLVSSCDDVDYDKATYSEAVKNLAADYSDGSRKVTLTWENPTAAGLAGIQIIKDNSDVTVINEVVTEYLIKKAPVNTDVAYTVKAIYEDGRVSEGQTVRLHINYQRANPGHGIAMLVPDDYTESADEAAAVAWFQTNYVDAGNGIIVTPATIDDLNIEEQGACWVMCDRIGVELGWEKLPGNLAGNEVINSLKAYAADGGNLFLTNHATQLTVAIGRIPDAYAPGIFGNGAGGYNGDTWGSQALLGNVDGQIYDRTTHAIYEGMDLVEGLYERPIFCFEGAGVKGDHNCMWDLNAYGFTKDPNTIVNWEEATNSTVLGTWNHVVDYCCAGIVDFNPTTTVPCRILAVGLAAYEWDIEGLNDRQDQLELFTSNCINYLKQ